MHTKLCAACLPVLIAVNIKCDIITSRCVWVFSLDLAAAAAAAYNENRSSIVDCIVNTHLISASQRER